MSLDENVESMNTLFEIGIAGKKGRQRDGNYPPENKGRVFRYTRSPYRAAANGGVVRHCLVYRADLVRIGVRSERGVMLSRCAMEQKRGFAGDAKEVATADSCEMPHVFSRESGCRQIISSCLRALRPRVVFAVFYLNAMRC